MGKNLKKIPVTSDHVARARKLINQRTFPGHGIESLLPTWLAEAEFHGWCQCLDSIRGSLRGYPNCGGDIEIMKEIERIEAEAIERIMKLPTSGFRPV